MTTAHSNSNEFSPPLVLRNPHIQSLLAGVGWRRKLQHLNGRALERRSLSCLLDCGEGVRLQGFYTPPPGSEPSRGLVVLLHGWEGSSRSTYLLSLGRALSRQGYEIFRLNYRDHGESHHLNIPLFHSCRLREVVCAVKVVATRFPTRPLHLVGFSLGGNFALRVARCAPEAGIPLTRVVAVSPVIDPARAMASMDNGQPLYRRHFMEKWRRSLRIKQRLFPRHYDFEEWMRLPSLTDMTTYLIESGDEFETVDDYLEGYSVAGARLAALRVPTTIIAASDDPVIPIDDLLAIECSESMTIDVQPHGGHCAFVSTLGFDSWIDERVPSLLDPR